MATARYSAARTRTGRMPDSDPKGRSASDRFGSAAGRQCRCLNMDVALGPAEVFHSVERRHSDLQPVQRRHDRTCRSGVTSPCAQRALPVSTRALATVFHGQLCRFALEPCRGSVDGGQPLAMDAALRLLARHRNARDHARLVVSSPFRAGAGFGSVDARLCGCVLPAGDAVPAVCQSLCGGTKRRERANCRRGHQYHELETLRTHGPRASPPAPIPRPRSGHGTPDLLVHGKDAVVSVHRDARVAGRDDCLCREHLGAGRHQCRVICDGGQPAAHGDQ